MIASKDDHRLIRSQKFVSLMLKLSKDLREYPGVSL